MELGEHTDIAHSLDRMIRGWLQKSCSDPCGSWSSISTKNQISTRHTRIGISVPLHIFDTAQTDGSDNAFPNMHMHGIQRGNRCRSLVVIRQESIRPLATIGNYNNHNTVSNKPWTTFSEFR